MNSPKAAPGANASSDRSRPSGPATWKADARALFGALPRGVDSQGVIAAIGANTGTSGGYAYVIGFGYAARVLLRSLTRRVNSRDPDDFVPEDALIHPLAFCARHFVELFLKDIPREIYGLRGQSFQPEEHHSIDKLWDPFEVACGLDRRLRQFPGKLRDAVMAMSALDPTGQTFRYRNDKDNQMHLEDLAVIHVPEFEHTFMQLFDVVEDLYAELEGLRDEYSLGTYTDQLSRADLDEIARRIGEAAREGKQALKIAQSSIQTDFSLSRSQYAQARERIAGHYGLSSLAGKDRPLKELSADTLAVAVNAIFENEAAKLLERSDVAALWGVLCAGDHRGAAEYYDIEGQAFLANTIPTDRADVLRRLRNKPTHLRRGLSRLGQTALIQALDAMVSEEELRQFENRSRSGRWSHTRAVRTP